MKCFLFDHNYIHKLLFSNHLLKICALSIMFLLFNCQEKKQLIKTHKSGVTYKIPRLTSKHKSWIVIGDSVAGLQKSYEDSLYIRNDEFIDGRKIMYNFYKENEDKSSIRESFYFDNDILSGYFLEIEIRQSTTIDVDKVLKNYHIMDIYKSQSISVSKRLELNSRMIDSTSNLVLNLNIEIL